MPLSGPFSGDYAGFNAPANNITAEQIDNIKTLTLTQNVSLSGTTINITALYDGDTTSKPDGDASTVKHEIEVYAHNPFYVKDWIERAEHSYTDSQGINGRSPTPATWSSSRRRTSAT